MTHDLSLLSDLSPSAILQLRSIESPTPTQRALHRGRVTRQVRSCTSCQLHLTHTPTPYAGPRAPSFVVVGSSPAKEEIPAFKLFRALMSKVGIDCEDDVLWTNTVSCGVSRPPTDGEQAFCQENLMDQVGVGYTRYVLLVGAKAMNAFRSDLQVTRDHGKVFVWLDTYCVMPIIHPAAALKKREFRQSILADLEKWCEVVWGGDDPTKYLGETCVKCGQGFSRWDRDGVPWCDKHYDAWANQWYKERMRWVNAKIEPLRMF